MASRRWIVTASLVALFLPSDRPMALAQTDVRTFFPEVPARARSLEEMFMSSRVVLVGTVSEIGEPTVRAGAVRQRYVIAVDDVLKDPEGHVKGSRITLAEPGGAVRQADTEYRTNRQREPLRLGDTAVLFLDPVRIDDDDVFEARFGAAESLRVSDNATGTIAIEYPASALVELVGRKTVTRTEIVSLLRRYR
jgi:hypothetical protein